MTNHPAIIEAAARELNDELTILRADLDGAEDVPDALAAIQRCAWIASALINYAARHGARAGAWSLNRMIEEERRRR